MKGLTPRTLKKVKEGQREVQVIPNQWNMKTQIKLQRSATNPKFTPRRWTCCPSQCWGSECCLPKVLPSIFSWLPSYFSFKANWHEKITLPERNQKLQKCCLLGFQFLGDSSGPVSALLKRLLPKPVFLWRQQTQLILQPSGETKSRGVRLIVLTAFYAALKRDIEI